MGLVLVLGACSSRNDATETRPISDMYGQSDVEANGDAAASDEEVPYSDGPTEIPDDLELPSE